MEQETQNKKQEERIVRIISTDVEGKVKIYAGLAKIKGVSWSLANGICRLLKMDKKRIVGSLTEEEVKKISEIVKSDKIPKHLLNRRNDFDTGEDKHLTSGDLELTKEFDIKRLKKIKSYRGLRHSSKLPLRGQRTKSNFRKNRRKGSGIKKKVKQ